jgi:hypothetical protein
MIIPVWSLTTARSVRGAGWKNKPLADYVKAGIHEAVEIVAGPESFVSEWKDFSTFFRMLQYRILVEKPGLHDTLINIQKANPMN